MRDFVRFNREYDLKTDLPMTETDRMRALQHA
jgi:hypothetical protein